MGLWSVKLICFYHLSWSAQADRQQPRIAVHPLDSLCLSSQVWRTIFSSVWAAALMCAMFFTCSSSFHFISWAGLLWRSCYLADVSVCFWMLLGGFKRLFLFFCLCAKRESSRLLQAFCSMRSRCPDVPEWKCLFNCSLIPWKKKVKDFINFYSTIWKEKVFDNMNLGWFSLDKNAVYNCVTSVIFWVLCISRFFSCLFISVYWWLFTLGCKLKSDGEAYFKGHYGSSRHLLDLAERETCSCASRLRAKWFLLARVKLMADCSAHLVQLGGKKHFPSVLPCLPSST